jgi:ATP-binding cassette subfamily B protein
VTTSKEIAVEKRGKAEKPASDFAQQRLGTTTGLKSAAMIFQYWFRSKNKFLECVFLQLISTLCALITPILLGDLIGSIATPPAVLSQWGIAEWQYLLIMFVSIAVLGLLSFLFGRAGRIVSATVSAQAMYYLRQDIHDAIYRQSYAYFDKHETGQLVARATSDVDQTDQIFGFGLNLGVQTVIQLLGVLIISFFVAPQLAWIFLVIMPTSFVGIFAIVAKIRPIYFEARNTFGELTNTIRENILGAQVVRIFDTQDKETEKFMKNNDKFYRLGVRSQKFNTAFQPWMTIMVALATVFNFGYGGYLIINNKMPFGYLITFSSYIGMSIFPMMLIGQIMVMYIMADAALTRIRQIFDSAPGVEDIPGAKHVDRFKGDIEFDKVTFGYVVSTPVLKGISFKVPAGQKIAILGTTGSGKSTIINLIPRFYDINEGEIKIDGVNIRNYMLTDLRRNVGIVSQDTFLFDKTIRENIAFGKDDATLDEVIAASKIADLHDFIETLPDKYETIVGERGTRLSGGQKQRLSIARAIIVHPSILIMDDSTSSVDVETEYHIQQALNQIMKDTTSLVITQRISTIRDADQILVLDKGRVVGLGTHDDLIQNNVLYRQIYETLERKQLTHEPGEENEDQNGEGMN